MPRRVVPPTRVPLLEQVRCLQAEVAELDDDFSRSERLAGLGMLVGLIAHEFNNILTPLISYLQLALDNPDRSDLSRLALEKTWDGTTRANMVAELILGLATSADSSGAKAPRGSETACVKDSALAALNTINDGAVNSSVYVRIEMGDNLRVAMSRIALETVLVNLVLNARTAMLPTGGELILRAKTELGDTASGKGSTWNISPDRFVRIEVRDTGRGMTTLHLQSIRAANAKNQGEPNEAGFGLSLCRRLVEEAGGTLEIESELGIGTICSVRVIAA